MTSIDNINANDNNEIPMNYPITNINLPNKWTFYLYNKDLFRKIANRPNFHAKPHREICTLNTVNDLVYILKIMEIKNDNKSRTDFSPNKINLDANDYIIMRQGIEPIWEDPKNSNGGTFTIKMSHSKGYHVWTTFVMYMLGETLTYEMDNINGMTVSYISDSFNNNNSNNDNTNNNNYTYIKIWDAKPSRTEKEFLNILPMDIINMIKGESIKYIPNVTKKHYGQEDIISKIGRQNNNQNKKYQRDRGGFSNYRKRNF